MYGVSVKVVLKWGKVCWDAERCGNVGGAHTLFYTSSHTLFIHLTTLPTLTPLHLFPHPDSPDTSSHTHMTRLSTLNSHLPTLPHTLVLTSQSLTTLTSPDTFPSPSPTLPHIYSLYFLTNPTPPATLPRTPHTLSFTPYQNFSLFSFIAKIVYSIIYSTKYTRNSLLILHKNLKTKIKNGYTTSKL